MANSSFKLEHPIGNFHTLSSRFSVLLSLMMRKEDLPVLVCDHSGAKNLRLTIDKPC